MVTVLILLLPYGPSREKHQKSEAAACSQSHPDATPVFPISYGCPNSCLLVYQYQPGAPDCQFKRDGVSNSGFVRQAGAKRPAARFASGRLAGPLHHDRTATMQLTAEQARAQSSENGFDVRWAERRASRRGGGWRVRALGGKEAVTLAPGRDDQDVREWTVPIAGLELPGPIAFEVVCTAPGKRGARQRITPDAELALDAWAVE